MLGLCWALLLDDLSADGLNQSCVMKMVEAIGTTATHYAGLRLLSLTGALVQHLHTADCAPALPSRRHPVDLTEGGGAFEDVEERPWTEPQPLSFRAAM
ncbi:hypothetical protein BJY59DRAFT_441830 [Rhodotorula toruloides]